MKNGQQVLTLQEKQKIESLRRMRMFHLLSQVQKDFENNDIIYYSERLNNMFNAVLYTLNDRQEFMDLVNEFEQKYNAKVYHAQLTHTEFGDNLALFYVSDSEDEWSNDRSDIEDNQAFVRVVNLDDDCCNDFGYIGVKSSMGGVVRTW